MKDIQKTILIFYAIMGFSFQVLSQTGCELTNYNIIPPTPYTNSYLQFDGKGDFLRNQNFASLNLSYDQTDSFSIETRIKINAPFTPMRILGKYYGTGWLFSYNIFNSGEVSFTIGSITREVYLLNADTSWHNYKILFSKASQILTTAVDENVINTYTGIFYGPTDNASAFSIGNTGFPSTYGWDSYLINGFWFKGGIDFLKINRNGVLLVKYEFNEGAGQFALDSASYYLTDRVLPGVTGCNSMHMMLGYMNAVDTCDPSWIIGDGPPQTKFFPLGTGLSYYVDNPNYLSYADSYSSGLTVWDGKLVNSGRFNRAGGNSIQNIALWNGTSWLPVGNGLNSDVTNLAVYNGELYAAGFFDSAYGFGETKHIAKWDGTRWSRLGNGANDVVNTMYEFNGDLYVGGFFMSVGEIYAPKIARWDGSSWHSLGSGIIGTVYSICSYKGELYVAGNFVYAGEKIANGIARWNGVDWETVGDGIHGSLQTICSLCVFQNELWAAGSFTIIDGKETKNLARYNGKRWMGFNPGAEGYICPGNSAYVTKMKEFNNSLYVTGMFTNIGGVNANKIASFNGDYWCPVEYGPDLRPKNLEVYNNNLIINGEFYSISGQSFGNIAGYNPSALSRNIQSIKGTGKQLFALNQNYPNPFNPSTEIKFESFSAGDVKLAVYNSAGQRIAVLVNGYLDAGLHRFTFNGSNLASGIYFYKLTSGTYSEAKKMLMIK
jgi:type IX secretion system substrate protein